METGPLGTLSFRIVRGDLRSPPAMESGVGNAGGEGDGQAGVRVRGGGVSVRGVRGVESHFAQLVTARRAPLRVARRVARRRSPFVASHAIHRRGLVCYVAIHVAESGWESTRIEASNIASHAIHRRGLVSYVAVHVAESGWESTRIYQRAPQAQNIQGY